MLPCAGRAGASPSWKGRRDQAEDWAGGEVGVPDDAIGPLADDIQDLVSVSYDKVCESFVVHGCKRSSTVLV